MELRKLKVAAPHMAGYTGVLGRARFKDGVSEEYLPRHIRDRMAAGMAFLEVDQDGNETPAGSLYRQIAEAKSEAELKEPLARQTEAEKAAELAKAAIDANPVQSLETRESLEAIADRSGIAGLREIASKWNVKHRSIVVLIEMILEAQDKYVIARNKRLSDRAADEALRLEQTSPQPDMPVEPPVTIVLEGEQEPDENEAALAAAAASGDLATALTAE